LLQLYAIQQVFFENPEKEHIARYKKNTEYTVGTGYQGAVYGVSMGRRNKKIT